MATERYQFPLNDIDYYNGKIIFQVRIEDPPELNFSSDNVRVDGADEEGFNFSNFASDLLGRTSVTGKTITRLGPRATLYMPQGLQFQDGVVYERADLGRIGGGAELAIQNGSSLGGAFVESFQNQAAAVMELFNKSLSPDAARLAAARAAKFGGANFGEGVQSALRVTTNPNTRQLFKEVNIRDFSFSFKLIPVSKEEADMAKALIKFFRTELYPEDSVNIEVGGGQAVPIGYRFPNTFDIYFKHKDQNVIHRLLPCYLVNISTNYNPGGAGFFEDGNFTEIEVSMNFRESRTLTKRLVAEGGY
jgi:hypothetical protein